MITWVTAQWVEEHLDSPDFLVLDPRSALRYMAGHAKNAVNVPVAKARGKDGYLLPAEQLADWLGAAGLDEQRAPVLVDDSDGRNAAMLAWILLYLGRSDVHLMETLWQKWVADGREVFYRPVAPVARRLQPRLRAELRATREQVQSANGARLVDFRSRDEFTGKLDTDGRPGHIPGAVNIVWQELGGSDGMILATRERLAARFDAAGILSSDSVVAHCRSGIRAAVGFLALTQLGRRVALYDGSYAEWAKSGLPVETSEA